MDAGASASARPAGLPVHDARPVGCAHPASRARPAGAASHSRKGAGRGLDRPLAASAAGPRPAITARRPVNSLKDRGRGLRGTEKRKMNTSVNELLSNPAFRPLVLLDVLAVFLMIICLVFRRMRKGYYVEQANDARKATMLNIAVRNVTGMGVYSAPGYWDNGDLNLCRFERASYEAVLGPRPYKRRPVQVIRVGQRLWQGFVPAMFDLFGERVPDHVCLHLVRRWDNPQPGLAFVPLGRNSEDILDACDETHGPGIPRVIDIDKE